MRQAGRGCGRQERAALLKGARVSYTEQCQGARGVGRAALPCQAGPDVCDDSARLSSLTSQHLLCCSCRLFNTPWAPAAGSHSGPHSKPCSNSRGRPVLSCQAPLLLSVHPDPPRHHLLQAASPDVSLGLMSPSGCPLAPCSPPLDCQDLLPADSACVLWNPIGSVSSFWKQAGRHESQIPTHLWSIPLGQYPTSLPQCPHLPRGANWDLPHSPFQRIQSVLAGPEP